MAAAGEAFRALKGDVENLLHNFEVTNLHYDRLTPDYFHPGRSARVLLNGQPVGQFGQLASDIAAARKLRQDIYLAEIDLERLYALPLRKPLFTPLPKYPGVERDFSFVFADAIAFEEIHAAVCALRIVELRAFQPIEIFRGGSVPRGSYSILLRATLQSDEGTFRDDQITAASGKIVAALQSLGGMQRV